MPALMIRRKALFLITHDLGFALRSGHDTFNGFLEGIHADRLLIATRRKQRRLIHEIAEIRTRKARRPPCQDIEIRILVHWLALRMHLQDCQAAAHIRLIDHDLTVETAWAQKRRIEYVRTVRRRDDDDALIRRKAIHLNEQLVECLLALIMAAADTGTALPAHGIDFIDEDDARGIFLRLIEQVTYPGGTDTDEHLDEIRTADREERHTGLTGNCPRQKGLACARRAKEQYALRDARPELIEFLRMLQELDNLLELLLRLIGTSHIGKIHLHLIRTAHAGPALAERHHAAAAALCLLHDEEPHANQKQHRQQRREHRRPPRRLRRVLRFDIHILRLQLLHQV